MRKGFQNFEPIDLNEVKDVFQKVKKIYCYITNEMIQYFKNYYEKLPQYDLYYICFSLLEYPLELKVEENFNSKDTFYLFLKKTKKIISEDERIKDYFSLWLDLRKLNNFTVYNSEMNAYSELLIEHKDQNELYEKIRYEYRCDMFKYDFSDYHFYINKYKKYQKLKNMIKQYELLQVKYSDAINKDLKLDIYAKEDLDNFTLSAGEAKQTFQRATKIVNQLLENMINDFLLPFSKHLNGWDGNGRFVFGKMELINVFSRLPFFHNLRNVHFSDEITQQIADEITEPFNYLMNETVSSFENHSEEKEKFETFLKEHHIDSMNTNLFKEFYNTISLFSSITFEQVASNIFFTDKYSMDGRFYYDQDKKKYVLEDALIRFNEGKQLLNLLSEDKNIELTLKEERFYMEDEWKLQYLFLSKLVDKYSYLIEDDIKSKAADEKIKLTTEELFNSSNRIKKEFLSSSLLSFYDLSLIDCDGKDISGIDISRNLEINIHFDKIVKDIENCNFNGYNLSHTTLRDFNIKDTDLRNTSATIDLETCSLSHEGKMSSGTLFDEDNRFLFGEKELSREEVAMLNIKIYKKEL